MKFTSNALCALLAGLLVCAPALGQKARRAGKGQARAAKTNPVAQRIRAIEKLLEDGRTDEALEATETLVESFPDNPNVYYKSYEISLSLGQLKEAEEDLQECINLTTDEAVKTERQQQMDALRAKLADIERQKREAAEKAARLQAENEEKAARLNFIQNRIGDGNVEVALDELKKLATSYASDPDLLYKAFELALQLENFDVAEKWLDSSISLTTDPSAKALRKQQVLELKFKRDQAEEIKRRQELAVRFKKLSLMASVGKEKEVTQEIDTILQAHPQDADVHHMTHDVYTSLGDFVAAEFHLNKSIELAKDAKTKNERQLQFLDLNHKREKAVETLVSSVDKFVQDMNYTEAAKAIKGLDNIVLYHQKAYILRGGLLGLYRQYEEAVRTYNRVLEDPKLSHETHAEISALRDYSVKKATSTSTKRAGMKHCHFCHAELSARAAYCHQCLAFQHPINLVRWKNTRVNFSWEEGRITGVKYHFENRHNGSNAFSLISGMLGAAAVGAGATPTGPVGMSMREAEIQDRNFSFKYEGGVPQGVRFNSSANGGEVTTMELQGATTSDPVWVVNETGGGKAAFKLEDILVYPNNPKVDPIFGQMAFRQNITRGFAPNGNFDPSMWNEPHIFVFYYDADGRVERAVESLTYSGESTPAGHRVSNGRKSFTGPNRLEPLNDPVYTTFTYNQEGLISSIVMMNNGKETYRREMVYGPSGIMQERESSNRKVIATWKYNWRGGNLSDAVVDNKNWQDQTIIFQPQAPGIAATSSTRAMR